MGKVLEVLITALDAADFAAVTSVFCVNGETSSTTGSMDGNLTAFSGANAISGADSSASGTPSSTSSETVDSIAFSSSYANPEMHPDSGDIIYIENRRPISRASDQTEDVKIIVEF